MSILSVVCCLQQKRLVAQCAERLAEYRHLVHGAAGGARDEMAFKVGQSLDALESGQVRCCCSVLAGTCLQGSEWDCVWLSVTSWSCWGIRLRNAIPFHIGQPLPLLSRAGRQVSLSLAFTGLSDFSTCSGSSSPLSFPRFFQACTRPASSQHSPIDRNQSAGDGCAPRRPAAPAARPRRRTPRTPPPALRRPSGACPGEPPARPPPSAQPAS